MVKSINYEVNFTTNHTIKINFFSHKRYFILWLLLAVLFCELQAQQHNMLLQMETIRDKIREIKNIGGLVHSFES